MKILLLGKNGQIGCELQKTLSLVGKLLTPERLEVDLADIDGLRSYLRAHHPDFIVNAAAYTAVDRAEVESNKARLVNEISVEALAEEAYRMNAWLIHYSTDYVFDGKKSSAYIESDPAFPLNVYGQTKFGGEQLIRSSKCKHLIFRCSWVYSIHRTNFALTILNNALNCERIDVVSDCYGTPTSASLIANATALVLYRIAWDSELANSVSGTYHLVASGATSWYNYAKYLISSAEKKGLSIKAPASKVFPIHAMEHKAAARRPRNSQLDNKKFCDQFGLALPEWQEHVERFIHMMARLK